MSLALTPLFDEFFREIGDSAKTRISQDDAIQFYNDTLEDMTLRYRVLEQDQTFNIEANEDQYFYPDDMVQMKRLQYSPTPSDVNTYRDIGEAFEDEIRANERWMKSVGDAFSGYWARAQFFQLTPKPTVLVTDGGSISYWKSATRITVVAGSTFELAAMFRRLVRERMVIYAKKRLSRYVEMAADLQVWETDLARVAVPIEDRSDDRRSRLRPARTNGGMV